MRAGNTEFILNVDFVWFFLQFNIVRNRANDVYLVLVFLYSYDRKLDEENYNPFGRGGAGAPVKDAHGNAISEFLQYTRISKFI